MPQKPLEKLEQFAIDVILERRYGKRAAVLRWGLLGLSYIYAQIIRLRCWAYRTRVVKWHHVGCRVISIGNLTVGGTGKTPVVEQFARSLTRAGRKVAILSRGYKSTPLPLWKRLWYRLTFRRSSLPPRIVSNGRSVLLDPTVAGDEPFMLASNLEQVYVLVDKNRVKSAVHAIKQFGVDTILLDDGYQYLPFRERLNVVLVDREAPFGNEFLLPRGTLREPHSHLRRADVIFITKCDGGDLSRLKARIRRYNCHAEILECTHHPLYLKEINTGRQLPLSYLQGRKVGAVAGIAVPESFVQGVELLGAEVIYRRFYADHHYYSAPEITNAMERTRTRGGHALITTEKDAVRLPKIDYQDMPVYFLKVEIKLLNTEESLHDCILRISNADRSVAAAQAYSLMNA
jgi:tetraacyldisaccharide 4'-kinase